MVNPALIRDLTNKQIPQTNVLGAVNDGLTMAGTLQRQESVSALLRRNKTAERRQAELQRILSVTPQDQQVNALMSSGFVDQASKLGTLRNNQNVFTQNQQTYQQKQEETNRILAKYALDTQNQDDYIASLPEDQQLLARVNPQEYAKQSIGNVFEAPEIEDPEIKPPTIKTFNDGSETVTSQWNPLTGEWDEQSRGPRWNPDKGQGVTIFDPDTGNPVAQIGGSSSTFGRSTSNKIGEAAFNAANLSARMDAIAGSYDRGYLETGTRAWATAQNFLDKFNLGTSSPEEVAYLDDMVSFYTDSFHNLNTTLKELSGAAVTPHEMTRLIQELPAPGELKLTTLLSGDGPKRFESKLKAGIRRGKLALARYSYYTNTGKIEDFDRMKANNSLPSIFGANGQTGVDSLIQKRGDELEKMYKQTDPDADDIQVGEWVKGRLETEFGIRLSVQ